MLETESDSKDDYSNKESKTDDLLHKLKDCGDGKDSFQEHQHKEENFQERNKNVSVDCYCKTVINDENDQIDKLNVMGEIGPADEKQLQQKIESSCETPALKDKCDKFRQDEKVVQENVNIQQEFNTSKKYLDNKTINEDEIINNQTSLEDCENAKDPQTDGTKDESDVVEADECLQFTRNFKMALEQAEARGKVQKAANNQTFQPLRRATKRISNRIKFLQEQLQQEVASGFTNRKTVERLKKQLAEAEEMSASIQTIRKHHRSVSRSGQSTVRTRHSVTPGKRERPYRQWHGLTKVVTPGPDCRFIISSKDAKESKTSVGPLRVPRSPIKEKLTKEVAVNTIVEEIELDISNQNKPDTTVSKCLTSNLLEEDSHNQEYRLPELETCSDKDVQNQNLNVAIDNETQDELSTHYSHVRSDVVNNKSETEFSNDGTSPIHGKDMLADIADAIERLDLKHTNPIRVNNNKLKHEFFNNNIQLDDPDGFHAQRNEHPKFAIDIDNLKQERSNKSPIIDRPNPFRFKNINQGHTPIYKPVDFPDNISYDRTVCQSQYSYSLQDSNNPSSPIIGKRFTSPYYTPKRSSNSKAYHPMPCIDHLKHGSDSTQSRLRRHKDRSLSRMAARSGSRSLARQHRSRGMTRPAVISKTDQFTEDIEREIELMRDEALMEKQMFSRASQEPNVSSCLAPTRNTTESDGRLINKTNSLRRGLKYVEVRATQDYKGKLPGQLTFKAGQCIKIRHSELDAQSDGLVYGYYKKGRLRKKKKGLFPLSYVELQCEMQTAL